MITCIVIDDEPLALQQLEKYATDTPMLDLKGSFDNAVEALEFLRTTTVDLLFVDINMPQLSGLEFVEALPCDVKVVFVTAYREYALEGFRLDAADYILKPLSYASFLQCVEKVYQRYFAPSILPHTDTSDATITLEALKRGFMFVRSEYRSVRVDFADILYIESKKEYLDFVMSSGSVITSHGSLTGVAEKLPSEAFIRVHRSFIVNLNQISVVERNCIVFGKQYIPISEQARSTIQDYLNGISELQ